MLKHKHRNDTFGDTLSEDGVSAEAEARIREDERRRVLAGAGPTDDWSTTPPSPDEPHVDDPRDADRIRPQATTAVVDDPRRWDVADERPAERQPTNAYVPNPAYVPDTAYAVDEEVVTRRAAFSPGQILILAAGAAALALGIVAVVRAGIDHSLSEPVVQVLGWDHTALLGVFEIGAGALLLLAGLRPGGRWLAALVGVASIVGGALILGRMDWTMNELGAEQVFGWVPIVIGAVALLGAAVPRRVRTERHVTSVH